MSGFFALLPLFLPGRGFILRVRKTSFLGDNPRPVDVPFNTANFIEPALQGGGVRREAGIHPGMYTSVYTPGRHI